MISLYGNTIKLKIDSKFYVADGCVMFCIKIKRIITLYVYIFVFLCYVFCVFALFQLFPDWRLTLILWYEKQVWKYEFGERVDFAFWILCEMFDFTDVLCGL